jgi:biopolymer transport protein ExbB/TolQ
VQSQRDAIETFQREPEDEQEAKMARWLNHGWFAADSVLKIGLLGTIIGFILMLAPISTLVSFDPASLQKALGGMSGGMAVALYTTLTGLSVNIVLRFQFQFLADTMQSLMLEARSPSAKADA